MIFNIQKGKMKELLRRIFRFIFRGIPTIKVSILTTKIEEKELLTNKKILITGGSKGIGFAIAKRCVELGAMVTITGRNIKTLKAAEKQINSKNLHIINNDITVFNNLQTLIKKSSDLMNGITTLINNAGISLHERKITNVSEEDFDEQIAINLKGPYFLSKAFIEFHESQKSIRRDIIFISSERGLYGDQLPYGLTKAALNSLTKGLAEKYISQGLKVNAICPGITATDMTGYNISNNMYLNSVNGKRILLPDEIAELAIFVISDRSSSISGQIIAANEANHT